MKNFEFYENGIREMSVNQLAIDKQGNVFHCSAIACRDCLFCSGNGRLSCGNNKTKWLYEEYKESIKITPAIKAFAVIVNYEGYIARDSDNNLHWYKEKPHKRTNFWDIRGGISTIISKMVMPLLFNDLSFVQWTDDEPYKVSELAEKCAWWDEEYKGE